MGGHGHGDLGVVVGSPVLLARSQTHLARRACETVHCYSAMNRLPMVISRCLVDTALHIVAAAAAW